MEQSNQNSNSAQRNRQKMTNLSNIDRRLPKEANSKVGSLSYLSDFQLGQTVDRLFEDAERKNKKIHKMKIE